MTGFRRVAVLVVMHAVLAMAASGTVHAGERYALVVTGASGGPQYAERYDEWRSAFAQLLQGKLGYPEDHVLLLAEEEYAGTQKATRENVRSAIADIRKRATKDDVVLVVLVGHGSGADSGEGKFNLVGPDLSAREWADLLKPMPGRLVFINAASGSYPFIQELSAKNHIVITANDSGAQTYETVLPQFLVSAFSDESADLDKNGKVSVWEAFTYASAGVRQWFEQKGQLPTERPLLDDTGAGVGREAQNPGTDGAIARVTYLEPDVALVLPSDTALAGLMRRRADLESLLEELKARKESTPPDQYDADLEKLLVEIARIAVQIRAKS